MSGAASSQTALTDFDLHGLLGVRLLDATPDDLHGVRRQLGLAPGTLEREPDLTIRFVDTATTKPLTYVRLGAGAFNDDGFFVLSTSGNRRVATRIPFEQLGANPEVVCERGGSGVPHLLAMLNLAALSKGVLPLHASAFTVDSTGVLLTGWSKGGKTEALLACMPEGARCVGDEWIYLTEGGEMFGVPEPMRLWAWQLDQLPELLHGRPRADRLRLWFWSRLARLAGRGAALRLPGYATMAKAAPILGRQACLRVPPAELFGADRLTMSAHADVVVLLMSHDGADITAGPSSAAEVSSRMTASLADERAAFVDHYRQFRFAFPALHSPVIETAEATESALLTELLAGRPSVTVLHPYPCDLAALGHAVRSVVQGAVAAPDRADRRSGAPLEEGAAHAR